jgi:hypothetical protein
MARKSHFSFNKRQREIKKREKKQKKLDRRLTKRLPSPDESIPDSDLHDVQEEAENRPIEPQNGSVEEGQVTRFDERKS